MSTAYDSHDFNPLARHCFVCERPAPTGALDRRFHVHLCRECLPFWQATDRWLNIAVATLGWRHPESPTPP